MEGIEYRKMKKTYEITTWWSEEDDAYLAKDKESGFTCHGTTEAEAVKELFVALELDRLEIRCGNDWWEIPGVIVEFIDHGDILGRVVADGIAVGGDKEDVLTWSELKTGKYKYKPVGVPFENINEYATEIIFNSMGVKGKYGIRVLILGDDSSFLDGVNWYNCPEGFKGKTFPVTEELKKLLGMME